MGLGNFGYHSAKRRSRVPSYYEIFAATKEVKDKPELAPAAVIAVTGEGTNADRVNAIRTLSASGRGISNANLNDLTLPKDLELKGKWHNARAHNLKVEGRTKADFSGSAMHAEFTGGIAGSTFDGVKGSVEARDQAAHSTSWQGFGGCMNVAGSDMDNSRVKAVLMFSDFNNTSQHGSDLDIDSVFSDFQGMDAESGNFNLKSDFSWDTFGMGAGIKYSRFGARASVSATGMAVTGARFEKGATVFETTLEKADADNAMIEEGVQVPVGLCSTAMTTRQQASPLFYFRDKKLRGPGFAVGF